MADRRTEYTKKVIKEAVFKLARKKSLGDITVKEICEAADINRATFYRNYLDIFDLYEKLEEGFTSEADETGRNRYEIFEIMYKHKAFYRDFFEMRLSSRLLRNTVRYLFEQLKELTVKRGTYDEARFDISFQYNYNGIAGAAKDWLSKGCPCEPREFADVIYGFIAKQYK